jgi:hypothetical protein
VRVPVFVSFVLVLLAPVPRVVPVGSVRVPVFVSLVFELLAPVPRVVPVAVALSSSPPPGPL